MTVRVPGEQTVAIKIGFYCQNDVFPEGVIVDLERLEKAGRLIVLFAV